MKELQLHDIKPLTEIPDYSFYIFTLLISSTIIIILALLYFLYKHFKNRNTQQRLIYQKLQNITFSDAKKSAYIITKEGAKLLNSQREKRLFETLVEDLQQYKYKKDVGTFTKESQHKFKLFMDALDVK